jgi:hypothetical protein
MKYMLRIYSDEKWGATATEDDIATMMRDYGAFNHELHAAGAMVAGDPLESTSAATTVRLREGKALTTDGPFAETKEQLGGYYLIDVPSLDEALEWAAKIPDAQRGSVEVRPVMSIPAEMFA